MMQLAIIFCLLGVSVYGGARTLSPQEKADMSQQEMMNQTNSLEVSQVLDDGKMLILSDGTSWQIAPQDQNTVSAWALAGAAPVEVSNGTDPTYPYRIKNGWTGTTVSAMKVSEGNEQQGMSPQQNMPSQSNMSNQPNMSQPSKPMQPNRSTVPNTYQ